MGSEKSFRGGLKDRGRKVPHRSSDSMRGALIPTDRPHPSKLISRDETLEGSSRDGPKGISPDDLASLARGQQRG